MDYWKWYIAGPLIGLFVPLLLIIGNKLFGISSSFAHFCTFIVPETKKGILESYNAARNSWKFYFVIGIAIGALVSVVFLGSDTAFLPAEYYTPIGFLQLFIGGLFVGFGTRYASGCTSGHAITGISLLNWPSIKSTISFFVGGLVYTWLVVYVI